MDYSCPIMPDYPLWRNRPEGFITRLVTLKLETLGWIALVIWAISLWGTRFSRTSLRTTAAVPEAAPSVDPAAAHEPGLEQLDRHEADGHDHRQHLRVMPTSKAVGASGGSSAAATSPSIVSRPVATTTPRPVQRSPAAGLPASGTANDPGLRPHAGATQAS
jgi:hypothetical protein